MTKKSDEKAGKVSGRDPGVTVRVPLATVEILRKRARGVPANVLLSDGEVLYRLALRAVELGAEHPDLLRRA